MDVLAWTRSSRPRSPSSRSRSSASGSPPTGRADRDRRDRPLLHLHRRDLLRAARARAGGALGGLDGLDLADCRRPPLRRRDPDRPALRLHDARRLRRRLPDPRLRDRLHARRRGGAALPRLQGALHLLHAPARQGGEPPAAPRRLGHGRPLVLPADQLLAPAARSGRRGQEGVHHERGRRRDLRARALHPHPADRRRSTSRPSSPRRPRPSARTRRWPCSSRSGSSAAPWPSRRRSRSTPGSRTRWRARRRSAPSSTRRRW